MMLLLPGDVGAHILDLRLADGENAIAILPREVADNAGDLVFSHTVEPRFNSFTTSATVAVRECAKSRCT